MVYLDSSVVIYYVEQPPLWGPKAAARVAALLAGGERLAVSDLTRMECLVGPLRVGDAAVLADFHAFFGAAEVQVLPLPAAVYDRAAAIRARYGFQPLDSLHLGGAVEPSCAAFLTNDTRLSRFPDVPVEVVT